MYFPIHEYVSAHCEYIFVKTEAVGKQVNDQACFEIRAVFERLWYKTRVWRGQSSWECSALTFHFCIESSIEQGSQEWGCHFRPQRVLVLLNVVHHLVKYTFLWFILEELSTLVQG